MTDKGFKDAIIDDAAITAAWEFGARQPEWPGRPLFMGLVRSALGWVWQRAQEAEREENCKAVCEYCAGLRWARLFKSEAVWDPADGRWAHEYIRDHKDDDENWQPCAAGSIRNRAARASEEPKA